MVRSFSRRLMAFVVVCVVAVGVVVPIGVAYSAQTVFAAEVSAVERLDEVISIAREKQTVQEDAAGSAFTADSFAVLVSALDAAVTAAGDELLSDEAVDVAAGVLRAALTDLVVASWSVQGVPLVSSGDVLSGNLGVVAVIPGDVDAGGSDGSQVALTLEGVSDSYPLFGVQESMGVLVAAADGSRPEIRVDCEWRAGSEVLVQGESLSEDSGVWRLDLTTDLDDAGVPSLTNVQVGGVDVAVEYGPVSGANTGVLTRAGHAVGVLDSTGQRFDVMVVASGVVDKQGLRDLIADAQLSVLPGVHHWISSSYSVFSRALQDAQLVLDDDSATPADVATVSAALRDASLLPVRWSAGGVVFDWVADADQYEVHAPGVLAVAPSSSVLAISNDEALADVSLERVADATAQSVAHVDLGVIRRTGVAAWEGVSVNGERPMRLQRDYSYLAGSKVEVVDAQGGVLSFTPSQDGVSANTVIALREDDTPAANALDVDGGDYPIVWSQDLNTTETATTATYSRTGHVEGALVVDGVSQAWRVNVTASRTEGKVASLSVIDRDPDGSSRVLPVDGFDAAVTAYEVVLDADRVTDAFTLGYESAAGDDHPVSRGAASQSLGEQASRVLRVTLNGVQYTVTVRFRAAVPVTDNPAARLDGLYVNFSGRAVQGALIEGWNPDVLDYVVRIGAADPGVYVLPVAADGLVLRAGDVRQSAYAVTQQWEVTAGNGDWRSYSVTVVRDHAQPTADEAFIPRDPVDVDGRTAPVEQGETGLVSHGYLDASGSYVVVSASEYAIPEDGVFAYASYAGQIVQPGIEKVKGMTWRYTLNVLAPDGVSFASHVMTVTYVTEATSRARLTAVMVDNVRLPDFDPSRFDYRARVNDLDHWTVGVDFDKLSGMSVTIHKEREQATITAVSADGLHSAVYMLDVEATGGVGTDAVLLASTGSGVSVLAVLMLAVLGVGVFLLALCASICSRRDRDGLAGEEPISTDDGAVPSTRGDVSDGDDSGEGGTGQ